MDDTTDLVHDAENTTDMQAIQVLVEKARDAPEEVQQSIIRTGLVRHLYPFEPRQTQVEAICHLVFQKKDLLLAAKTSFGKSVIFQSAPLFCRGGVGIIIIPLDRIGEEQHTKIQRLPGARSIFINGRTDKTDALAQDIEMGMYTHLIMSPEIAAGWFASIASKPSFKRRVSVVAVDELHLVALWGSGFRPQFAQLSVLRGRLGANIPWFGCSATLDKETLDIARKMTGFQVNCDFFRSSVDRPEIKLIVEMIPPQTTTKFTSLFFVLQEAMTNGSPTPEKIPKTIIFIDSRRDIQKCADCLRDWLHRISAEAIGARECRQIIQVYHSHTSMNDKNAIYDEFSKANSKIRIMVATESLGTGVDISDVERVVQYRFPLERLLSVLIQRFGRPSRMAGMKGEAIFLVESWAIGDKSESTRPPLPMGSSTMGRPAQTYSPSAGGDLDGVFPDDEWDDAPDVVDMPGQGKRKTLKERRTDLYQSCPALFDFVNRCRCLRKILMDWLQEYLSDPASRSPRPEMDDCCNVCNPNLTRTIPFPWDDITPNLRKPRAGTASCEFYDRLLLWGNNIVNSEYQMVKPQLNVLLFIPKSELISLSTEYMNIQSAADLSVFVRSARLKDHFDELFEEFNNIKSYVVRNWQGGSKSGSVAVANALASQEQRAPAEGRSRERTAPPESQDRLAPRQQLSQGTVSRGSVQVESVVTLDQGRGASFLRDRDEYASSLKQIIAQAREKAALCPPCPPLRSIPMVPAILSESPKSSQGEALVTNRVALGVLDPNVGGVLSVREKSENDGHFGPGESV